MENKRLFCFRFNYQQYEETNQIIIESVSYEQFCSYGRDNEINWKSYKEQLLGHTSPNIDRYEGAEYIWVKFRPYMYFFGFGLSKELIYQIMKLNSGSIKCFILYRDKTYKQIPIEDIYKYADKVDFAGIKQTLSKPMDKDIFICSSEHKEILQFIYGPFINEDKIKEIISNETVFNNMGQTADETIRKIFENQNKKPGIIDKLKSKVAMKAAYVSFDKLMSAVKQSKGENSMEYKNLIAAKANLIKSEKLLMEGKINEASWLAQNATEVFKTIAEDLME